MNHYRLMNICFIIWVIFPTLHYSVTQLFQPWPLGVLSVGPVSLCPTIMGLIFSSTSVLSSTTGCSRLILAISWSSPGLKHFCKELWFLLSENGIRNQGLGTACICCFRALSTDRTKWYVYSNSGIDTLSVNASLCNCLYLY